MPPFALFPACCLPRHGASRRVNINERTYEAPSAPGATVAETTTRLRRLPRPSFRRFRRTACILQVAKKDRQAVRLVRQPCRSTRQFFVTGESHAQERASRSRTSLISRRASSCWGRVQPPVRVPRPVPEAKPRAACHALRMPCRPQDTRPQARVELPASRQPNPSRFRDRAAVFRPDAHLSCRFQFCVHSAFRVIHHIRRMPHTRAAARRR